MARSVMADAFAHHTWATARLAAVCSALNPHDLNTPVPGTYGSILATMRHLVGTDSWYLRVATDDRRVLVAAGGMDLHQLSEAVQRQGDGWLRLLEMNPDAEVALREVDEEDGCERQMPLSIQLAQALHHGNDHRTQICSALSTLGHKAPSLDVWTFGLESGRTTEHLPET